MTIIKEDVDIYLPLVVAPKAGFPAGNVINPSHRATPDIPVTIGDLHGNTIKLLFTLIKHGIIENVNDTDYAELVQIYKKEKLTKEDFQRFREILERFTYNPAKFILIGDELADRGSHDYLTLTLLDIVKKRGIEYDILLSNHGSDFIRWYELNSPPTMDPTPSISRLKESIDEGIIDRSDVIRMVDEAYKPALKILHVDYDKNGLIIYSHAPIDITIIENLAEELDVEFHDSTPELLVKTIDRINEAFRVYVMSNTANKLIATTDFDKYGNLLRREVTFPAIEAVMWNRDESILTKFTKFLITFIHGHVGPQASTVTHINLDSMLGKDKFLNKETYLAFMNKSMPVLNPTPPPNKLGFRQRLAQRFNAAMGGKAPANTRPINTSNVRKKSADHPNRVKIPITNEKKEILVTPKLSPLSNKLPEFYLNLSREDWVDESGDSILEITKNNFPRSYRFLKEYSITQNGIPLVDELNPPSTIENPGRINQIINELSVIITQKNKPAQVEATRPLPSDIEPIEFEEIVLSPAALKNINPPLNTYKIFDFDCTLTIDHTFHDFRLRQHNSNTVVVPEKEYENGKKIHGENAVTCLQFTHDESNLSCIATFHNNPELISGFVAAKLGRKLTFKNTVFLDKDNLAINSYEVEGCTRPFLIAYVNLIKDYKSPKNKNDQITCLHQQLCSLNQVNTWSQIDFYDDSKANIKAASTVSNLRSHKVEPIERNYYDNDEEQDTQFVSNETTDYQQLCTLVLNDIKQLSPDLKNDPEMLNFVSQNSQPDDNDHKRHYAYLHSVLKKLNNPAHLQALNKINEFHRKPFGFFAKSSPETIQKKELLNIPIESRGIANNFRKFDQRPDVQATRTRT